jgi:hypothetical protein
MSLASYDPVLFVDGAGFADAVGGTDGGGVAMSLLIVMYMLPEAGSHKPFVSKEIRHSPQTDKKHYFRWSARGIAGK